MIYQKPDNLLAAFVQYKYRIFAHKSMSNLSITNYSQQPEDVKRSALRMYEWATQNNLNSLRIVIADQFYYNKTLEQRKHILGAPSTSFLCKTIVFQNTAYDAKFQSPFYPKYIAVMVQYVAKINSQKLNKEIRYWQQNNCPQSKASKTYFNYRLADENISKQLTGYDHNGVVPVLMNKKYFSLIKRMPIVFSHEIINLTPQFFWMGAGHPWSKMRVSFEEFRKSYPSEVLVYDITYEKGTPVELKD